MSGQHARHGPQPRHIAHRAIQASATRTKGKNPAGKRETGGKPAGETGGRRGQVRGRLLPGRGHRRSPPLAHRGSSLAAAIAASNRPVISAA